MERVEFCYSHTMIEECLVAFCFRLPIILFRGEFPPGLLTPKGRRPCITLLAITTWLSAGFCGVGILTTIFFSSPSRLSLLKYDDDVLLL